MKILGIVTLYNPPKEVGENLSSYAPFLDGLYLWDNTAGGSNVDSQLPPEVAKRVLMHRRGRNVGIAMALNAAIDLALKEGYTHLLTMDQDSRFKEGTFQAYLRDVEADTDDKHWAFCPLINRDAQSRQPLKPLKGLIVSGTILTRNCLEKVGQFFEPFVIDTLDTEYAFRILRDGGQIMLSSSGSLTHSLGQPLRRNFLCFHPVSLNYSPMRTYYISRNLLYLHRTQSGFSRPDLLKALVWKRPLYILLMEGNKWNKIVAWTRGVWQGWRRKLGPDPFFSRLS